MYYIEKLYNHIIHIQLPNHLLEELASDVYDEVDRRETDASEYNCLFIKLESRNEKSIINTKKLIPFVEVAIFIFVTLRISVNFSWCIKFGYLLSPLV